MEGSTSTILAFFATIFGIPLAIVVAVVIATYKTPSERAREHDAELMPGAMPVDGTEAAPRGADAGTTTAVLAAPLSGASRAKEVTRHLVPVLGGAALLATNLVIFFILAGFIMWPSGEQPSSSDVYEPLMKVLYCQCASNGLILVLWHKTRRLGAAVLLGTGVAFVGMLFLYVVMALVGPVQS